MIVKAFIFLIWAGMAQTTTADQTNPGAFISKQSWSTQTECEAAATRAMQMISHALASKGAENPVMFGRCIEYTPGQDV